MILFHIDALDLDGPDIRRRAWLPACLLRRAGLAARLVAGQVPADILSVTRCLILTGVASRHALEAARRAADAKVPVILDIATAEALRADAQREAILALAALADSITTENEVLARYVEGATGVQPVLVTPDALDIQRGLVEALRLHPGAAMRALSKQADGWARDVVARLRGRWPGHATGPTSRRIVWFGASPEPNGEGGVAELLLAASDLADLAEDVPLRLGIVGRSPRAARRFLKPLAIPIAFHRYAPPRVREQLRKADLCLLPVGGDEESQARSSWRARLASSLGVPVVAGMPGESTLPAMRAALAAGRSTRSRHELHTIRAREAETVVTAWRRAIDAAEKAGRRSNKKTAIRAKSKLHVLLLLQQFQDIDLIVPIAEAASADPGLDVRIAVLSKIAVPASRRLRTVIANGGKIEFWHGADLLAGRIKPARFASDVAVTASEGPGFGARFARAFVAASRAAGARVLSLQHGLDNGGLTYGPSVSPNAFRADLILTWGGLHRLTDAASAEVRERTLPVGCPKRAFSRSDFADFPLAERPFIAVFENLHWRRYDDAYRRRFVSDLAATAEALPEQTFLVKPHMGGRWFTSGRAAAKPLPQNIVIANPEAAQWRRFTADAFLAHASAVITTPSTIALDAARYGVPVAVVTYGIGAQNYRPLPRIEQMGDWRHFVEEVRCGRYDPGQLESFLAEATVPGDSVARILTIIRMAGARRSYEEIMSALDERRHGLAAS